MAATEERNISHVIRIRSLHKRTNLELSTIKYLQFGDFTSEWTQQIPLIGLIKDYFAILKKNQSVFCLLSGVGIVCFSPFSYVTNQTYNKVNIHFQADQNIFFPPH